MLRDALQTGPIARVTCGSRDIWRVGGRYSEQFQGDQVNIIRNAISALGGIFLAALMLAALMPRAARGVAAALVQIVNTDANPVATEDHARQAVVLSAFSESVSVGGEIPFTSVNGSPFSVPTGKRLVIEQISGALDLKSGSSVTGAALSGSFGSTSFYDTFLTTPTLTFFGGGDLLSEYKFSQSVRLYTDTTPSINFGIVSSSLGTVIATASGYLVDCTGACQ
jgi:hypothetical protein